MTQVNTSNARRDTATDGPESKRQADRTVPSSPSLNTVKSVPSKVRTVPPVTGPDGGKIDDMCGSVEYSNSASDVLKREIQS